MTKDDLEVIQEEVGVILPDIIRAYAKYERGVKSDSYLKPHKSKDDKPQRKYKRNKKANKKKWVVPVKKS